MQPFTFPLTGTATGDRRLIGGKARALAELAAAGLPVPPGFSVTTAAFECALAPAGSFRALATQAARLPADAAGIAAFCAEIQNAILAAPLPRAVEDQITGCYRALGDPPVPVAVRSSAPDEDGDAASFAGLASTYLWVQGAGAVCEQVRRCWASLYSAEAMSYRRDRGLPVRGLAMGAALVQAMVDPRCAGVMFTRSPLTGDSSVIMVEASWGLGSAVVSGAVTPDSYLVSKVTGEIVKRSVASKLVRHCRDAGGSGTAAEPVPPDLRDLPCLADEEVRAVAALGQRVSEHYRAPQDIEWAITAGSRVVLLQSRPETVWSRRWAAPIATPRPRPFDHVLDRLAGYP